MKKGSFVEIEYVGRIRESGEIFDLTDAELAKKEGVYNPSARYGPVAIVVGAGHVIRGLDEALEKMKPGESEEIDIEAERAFGQRNPGMIKVFNIGLFKQQRPVPGQFIELGGVRGRVMSVGGGRVRIDFNHPLAGKALHYEVKVRRLVTKADEKVAGLVSYHSGIKAEVSVTGGKAVARLPAGAALPDTLKKSIKDDAAKWIKGVKTVNFAAAESKSGKAG